ncbi:apolipoprotein N-acyltransferase [Microbacterium sp. GXF7504]
MPGDRPAESTPRPAPPLRLAFALPAAVAAGVVLSTAYPALGWWPAVFVGVPLALLTLIGRRVGGALLVGFVFGAAFYSVNVAFTARYLGPVPWLALSLFEALLTGVAAIAVTLAYRWFPRVLPGRWARLVGLPALVAGLWTMREQFLGSWPYGGFPWGRVGVAFASSPLAETASWVGISGLGFLVVFACAAAIEVGRLGLLRRPLAFLPTVVTVLVLVLVPAFPTTDAGGIRIGAVQGNGPTGYFDQRDRGEVFDAQLAATQPVLGEDLDLLVWPEGGVDSDPLSTPVTRARLNRLAAEADAPLLVNAATARGTEYFNTSILWEPGEGPTALYDKRHPVPFGEYVPDRWLYEPLAPDLIGLLQLDYTPGVEPPVMTVGDTRVGLAICFDVIYDDVVWDAAAGGAEVFVFQTNNADFRGTDENLQQLAFARMRAVETGRAVVNLSTVGTSQVIAPDGSVIDGLEVDVAGAMVTDVPLRTGLTPAVVLGPWLTVLFGWGSLVALVALGVAAGVRTRRSRTHTTTPAPEGTGVVER